MVAQVGSLLSPPPGSVPVVEDDATMEAVCEICGHQFAPGDFVVGIPSRKPRRRRERPVSALAHYGCATSGPAN